MKWLLGHGAGIRGVVIVFFVALSGFAVALSGLAGGCRGSVVTRDAATYRAEVEQWDRWAGRSAAMLRVFVSRTCACDDGAFVDPACREVADWLLTMEARHAWHARMALANAGLVDGDAGFPPPIPDSACPLPPGTR